MRVSSLKPAISIEFNDVDSNNLAGYKERSRVLYMIRFLFIDTWNVVVGDDGDRGRLPILPPPPHQAYKTLPVSMAFSICYGD